MNEECKEALAKHLNEYYNLEFMEASDIECVHTNSSRFGDDCECYMYKGCKRGYMYLIRPENEWDNDEDNVDGFVDNKIHKYCVNNKCYMVGRIR